MLPHDILKDSGKHADNLNMKWCPPTTYWKRGKNANKLNMKIMKIQTTLSCWSRKVLNDAFPTTYWKDRVKKCKS